MSVNKKRSAVERDNNNNNDRNAASETSPFKQITDIIAQSERSQSCDEYAVLLTDVQKFCALKTKEIEAKSAAKKISDMLKKKYASNEELIAFINQVKVTHNEHERLDYQVSTQRGISFGNLSFSFTYSGDNEGSGNVTATVRFQEKDYELITYDDEVSYEAFEKISYEKNPDLHEIHKLLKFQGVSSSLFLNFVVCVFDEAMSYKYM